MGSHQWSQSGHSWRAGPDSLPYVRVPLYQRASCCSTFREVCYSFRQETELHLQPSTLGDTVCNTPLSLPPHLNTEIDGFRTCVTVEAPLLCSGHVTQSIKLHRTCTTADWTAWKKQWPGLSAKHLCPVSPGLFLCLCAPQNNIIPQLYTMSPSLTKSRHKQCHSINGKIVMLIMLYHYFIIIITIITLQSHRTGVIPVLPQCWGKFPLPTRLFQSMA